MAIITFTSDLGARDHYVAAVKARMLLRNPGVSIVDITHHIDLFNIPHAAFVLRSVFRDFPAGTVHLCSVNSPNREKDRMIAVKLEDHYFIGADNGLFSLLSEMQPTAIIELRPDNSYNPVFPERTFLADAAVYLAGVGNIGELGREITEIRRMLHRQLKVTRERITGHVVHVDHYGNLITNISREVFDNNQNGRSFIIQFGMEQLDQISEAYYSVENGDCLVLFNSNGNLEIAISQGNASELLGLGFDSMVAITFI